MKLILSVFIVLLSITAIAKERKPQEYVAGSKCGLVDQWGDMSDISTTYDLSRSTRQVKAMNKIVKAQLVASANALQDLYGDKKAAKITDAVEAAKFLKVNSEAEELYVLRSEFKGKKFSVISYYGGGNHTGYIFNWGSSNILAHIGDDDIACVK